MCYGDRQTMISLLPFTAKFHSKAKSLTSRLPLLHPSRICSVWLLFLPPHRHCIRQGCQPLWIRQLRRKSPILMHSLSQQHSTGGTGLLLKHSFCFPSCHAPHLTDPSFLGSSPHSPSSIQPPNVWLPKELPWVLFRSFQNDLCLSHSFKYHVYMNIS